MIQTIKKFCQAFGMARVQPALPQAIVAVEAAIGFALPEEQKQFLSECGAVNCPRLLDVVVESGISLPVLQTVLGLAEIGPALKETREDGFDGDLIPFAIDPVGNYLCLKSDVTTVFLLDADLGKSVAVAESLENLLNSYLELN